jgi:hypothetical protein
MPDSKTSLTDRGRSLAKLLSEQALPQRVWTEDEIGAVLAHQWGAPLRVSLEGLDPPQRAAVKVIAEAEQLLLRSFGDLLAHRNPPLELLQITKDFAKAIGTHPGSPLPPDAARVLYLAAIAVARARCGQRISTMSDAELIDGITWTLARPWLPRAVAHLFAELRSEMSEEGRR